MYTLQYLRTYQKPPTRTKRSMVCRNVLYRYGKGKGQSLSSPEIAWTPSDLCIRRRRKPPRRNAVLTAAISHSGGVCLLLRLCKRLVCERYICKACGTARNGKIKRFMHVPRAFSQMTRVAWHGMAFEACLERSGILGGILTGW